MINSCVKVTKNYSFEFKIWYVNKNLSDFLLIYFQEKYYNIKVLKILYLKNMWSKDLVQPQIILFVLW